MTGILTLNNTQINIDINELWCKNYTLSASIKFNDNINPTIIMSKRMSFDLQYGVKQFENCVFLDCSYIDGIWWDVKIGLTK